MPSYTPESLTKITARIFAPVYDEFDKQITRTLLRRDAFLDRAITIEVPHLREDLAGKKLTPKARKYIASCLKSLGGKNAPPLKQISIVVSTTTAELLRAAVTEHNLQRDAFLNWLIVLLRSSNRLLDRLDLPHEIPTATRYGLPNMPISPMKAIEEIETDPLFYLRNVCEAEHRCGLYNLSLPAELHGLCCYLPDEDVPGTLEFIDRGIL